MTEPKVVTVPPGICAVTTYGQITVETTQALVELVRYCERNNLKEIRFDFLLGNLVDKSRNDAVTKFLATPQAEWLWFIDADMQFKPDLPAIMLNTAYNLTPWADIVGGYCQLRGGTFAPTIDTGTGLWEPHEPNQGPIEVIRTGGACLLVKRQVFDKMEYPWFGMRITPRPLDVIAEVDGYARQVFDGRNPLENSVAWKKLIQCAHEKDTHDKAAFQAVNGRSATPRDMIGAVGEDSNFTDKAKALGFRIVVQTDAVLGHVDRKVITAQDHTDAIKANREDRLAAVGVTG